MEAKGATAAKIPNFGVSVHLKKSFTSTASMNTKSKSKFIDRATSDKQSYSVADRAEIPSYLGVPPDLKIETIPIPVQTIEVSDAAVYQVH